MTTSHALKICRLYRPLLFGTLAIFGIIGGIVPDLSADRPNYIFANAARADEFNEPELRNYAAVLVQIEQIRPSALAQVSRANNGSLPNLVCNQPSTMEGLNGEAKSLFIRYCNQCESIASSRGLTIDKFNQITQAVRSNSRLQDRVRGFMN